MTNMKIVIGVTGRVGVGKTYLVNSLLKKYDHYNVIDLDMLGHEVLRVESIKHILKQEFGDTIINQHNEINRKALADIVFADINQLNKLNKISHPLIKKLAENRIKQSKEYNIIIVGSLIKEIGLLTQCNQIISVIADSKKTDKLIGSKKRIETFQATENEYKSIANHIFYNDFLKDGVEKFGILVQNLVS
tara:strand:+ start:2026 stop:2598 length:573 start_codon:yes stop_codon:yes gene_type:complete